MLLWRAADAGGVHVRARCSVPDGNWQLLLVAPYGAVSGNVSMMMAAAAGPGKGAGAQPQPTTTAFSLCRYAAAIASTVHAQDANAANFTACQPMPPAAKVQLSASNNGTAAPACSPITPPQCSIYLATPFYSYSAPGSSFSVISTASSSLTRMVDLRNRVVGGILITTNRRPQTDCPSRFKDLYQVRLVD